MSEMTGEIPTGTRTAASGEEELSIGAAWHALVEVVGELVDGRPRLWVLEAGARNQTLFDLPEHAYVIGVDRDQEALRNNVRLNKREACDLADYRPAAMDFDLITCWYVLDGIARPAQLLDRFAEWAADNGVIVLGVPNLRSPRALAAWVTRKSRLRLAVLPGALGRRFARHGFAPVFQVYFEDAGQVELRRGLRITDGRWRAVQVLVRILSLGLLDAAHTDYVVVFRRTR